MAKIKWYSKGKFEDVEEYDSSETPYLKIVKFNYKDNYSYNDYRYWVVNEKDRTILDNLSNEIFVESSNVKSYPSISEREFELVKNGTITITNNKSSSGLSFEYFKWEQLLEHFPAEAFYI